MVLRFASPPSDCHKENDGAVGPSLPKTPHPSSGVRRPMTMTTPEESCEYASPQQQITLYTDEEVPQDDSIAPESLAVQDEESNVIAGTTPPPTTTEWDAFVARMIPAHDGEADQEGNDIKDGNASASSTSTIRAYLNVKQLHQQANDTFGLEFGSHVSTLKTLLLDQLFGESVVPIHETLREDTDALESSIIDVFGSNHKRRHDLIHSLDATDRQWKQDYHRLTKRVRLLDDDNEDTTRTITQNAVASEEKEEQQDFNNSTVKNKQEEPNWNDLRSSFPPCQSTVQAFLAARAKRQQAEDHLREALDSIHDKLDGSIVKDIIQVLVECHGQHNENCMVMQEDIEYYLIDNHQRREAFQSHVEASAQKAQGLFAGLMSRLH